MLHHLSFAVADLKRSAAFYDAALGEHYYAAFVIDPDGYRIEAVINKPI